MNSFPSFLGLLLAFASVYCYALDPLTSAPTNARNSDRTWRNQAVHLLWKERQEMDHTPLLPFKIEGMPYLDFRFKNESASKTGNLKHRFSWALFMWALTEGFIDKNTTVYEASSGNTATSEAYMAGVIGVPFVAVVPDTTEQAKIDNIEKWGGKVHKADISGTFKAAEKLAKENNGFYMNQFGNAFLAEEFHESGGSDFESMNVFHEILVQLHNNETLSPHFFVHTAGTGGTISSVGRYVQKYGVNTQVILADTQYSMYYDYVINGRFSTENDSAATLWIKPGMAGTGYGYAGPGIRGKTTSLLPAAIDIAYKVPDLASTAAMHVLKDNGIEGGTSTGLNFITSLSVGATEKEKAGNDKLRIITLLCDSSSLYKSSYYNMSWIEKQFKPHGGLPVFQCWKKVISQAMKEGFDPIVKGNEECQKDDPESSTPAVTPVSSHLSENPSTPKVLPSSAALPNATPSENPLPDPSSSPEEPLSTPSHPKRSTPLQTSSSVSGASGIPSETSSSPDKNVSPGSSPLPQEHASAASQNPSSEAPSQTSSSPNSQTSSSIQQEGVASSTSAASKHSSPFSATLSVTSLSPQKQASANPSPSSETPSENSLSSDNQSSTSPPLQTSPLPRNHITRATSGETIQLRGRRRS